MARRDDEAVASTDAGSGSEVRAVTDEEVAHLRDHGWAKLDGLLSAELAARLLEGAKVQMGPGGDAHAARRGTDTPNLYWNDRHNVAADDETFASLCLDPAMGANAQRLMRRDVGVLMSANMLAVKIGTRQDSSCPSTRPTIYHQDAPDLPIDRSGYTSFWIALDRVAVDMGGLRFVDRSHRLGPLGRVDLFTTYPELAELPLSLPMEHQPGDATVHTMFTVHGTAANDTASPRWGLIVSYIPADALYTGGFPDSLATLAKRAATTLRAGDPFNKMLPTVYASGTERFG